MRISLAPTWIWGMSLWCLLQIHCTTPLKISRKWIYPRWALLVKLVLMRTALEDQPVKVRNNQFPVHHQVKDFYPATSCSRTITFRLLKNEYNGKNENDKIDIYGCSILLWSYRIGKSWCEWRIMCRKQNLFLRFPVLQHNYHLRLFRSSTLDWTIWHFSFCDAIR